MYDDTPSELERAAQDLAAKLLPQAVERDALGGNSNDTAPHLKESSLLTGFIPTRYGGQGAPFENVMAAVREIATVDSSLAQIFGWHNINVGFLRTVGSQQVQDTFYPPTVEGNLLWGNASSENVPRVLDWKVTAVPVDGGYRMSGTKHFCTGSQSADMLMVMAVISGVEAMQEALIFGVLPPDTPGMTINDDWDNIGQRHTESGSVTFDDVFLPAENVLGPPGGYFARPYNTLFAPSAQTVLANIYLGRAIGALRHARRYTQEVTRPWPFSGVSRAVEDPYILQRYGRMQTQLTAAVAVAERAARWTGQAWEAPPDEFTWEQRGRLMMEVSQAKILATEAALEVTSGVFEVMGARATTAKERMDRYWRDVRTLTLHDPVTYHQRFVGDWALTGTLPPAGFVS